MNLNTKLTNMIESDDVFITILKTVEQLALNDCWVAAGVIRNKVWDTLHNMHTDFNDIDVIYFDETDISRNTEKALEARLQNLMPNQPWSVKNQARMHLKNNVPPYVSSFDGVAHFPETPTAIAVRMINNQIEIMAPYGLHDLFKGTVRPTPLYQKGSKLHPIYLERMQHKKWDMIWRELVIEH